MRGSKKTLPAERDQETSRLSEAANVSWKACLNVTFPSLSPEQGAVGQGILASSPTHRRPLLPALELGHPDSSSSVPAWTLCQGAWDPGSVTAAPPASDSVTAAPPVLDTLCWREAWGWGRRGGSCLSCRLECSESCCFLAWDALCPGTQAQSLLFSGLWTP